MQRILVRHAQPLIAPGICYGALDIPADVTATDLAARELAAYLPARFSAWVSPRMRCRQLADALQDLRDDGVFTVDARLAEMDFGSWEGQAWANIPREAVDAWTADFGNHKFGGKESVSDVLTRVADAWNTAQGITLWITHAGIVRAATLVAGGTLRVDQADQWPEAAPPFGQWISLPV
jgi:alpha-ribazole phosphatase